MKPPTTAPELKGTAARQDAALRVVLAGGTQTEAAAAARVTRETVSRWVNHDASFIAAMNGAQQQLRSEAHQRLRSLLPTAVDALASMLTADTPAPIRLRAK